MAEKSAIQRIKELDDERAKLFDQAKEEALQKATQAVAELKGLGLNYQLISGDLKLKGDEKQLKKVTAKPRGTVKDAPCPVCEFMTSPPHDTRTHRGQSKKKPFTAKELADRNLAKVE